ncbi:MAG: glycoside hydrolase family protein [Verrucomicrobiota bacterium]|nr:glycoside hydrolase family protein [Verrucomicrobiota bacterium]
MLSRKCILKRITWFVVYLAMSQCLGRTMNAEDVHVGTLMQPVPKTSVFENDGFFVWGASMTQTDDGVCHLFYDRWPEPDINTWISNSEIAYATADSPSGPYRFKKVVFGKRSHDFWDGVSVYNPQILHANQRYYLYYVGNNGAGRATHDENGTLLTQRIGVAVADSPSGPWRRSTVPLLDVSEEGLDSNFVANPAVTAMPDGRFLMIYKCGDGHKVYHSAAVADHPNGPFVKTGHKIFDSAASEFPAEDPFIWYQDGKYHAILKDMHGSFSHVGMSLVQFESDNGLEWKPGTPVLVSKKEIHWDDGSVEKVERLERPQLWLEDGLPRMLFLALKQGNHAYNVHIPLAESVSGNVDTTGVSVVFYDNFYGAAGTLSSRTTPVGGYVWSDNHNRSILANDRIEVSANNHWAMVAVSGLTNKVLVLESDFLMNGADLSGHYGGATLGMGDGAGMFVNPPGDAISFRLITVPGSSAGSLNLFSKSGGSTIHTVTSSSALSGYDTDLIHLTIAYDVGNLMTIATASNTVNGTSITLTNLYSQAEVDALTIDHFGINTTGYVSGTAVWDNVSLKQAPEPGGEP